MKKAIILAFVLFILSLIPISFPVKAAPPIGNYLQFFGGYLKTETDDTYSPNGFTFEAWIKPEDLSGIRYIVSIGNESSNKFYYEVGTNGNSLFFNYRYSTGSQRLITAGNLLPDIWNHIAVAVSSSQTKLFINGAEIFAASGASQLLPIGQTVILGNSIEGLYLNSSVFKGEMDEIRISDTARNISSLWSSGAYNNSLTKDSNTIIIWHLDEQRGQIQAQDSSGNGFHAGLVGGDSKIHFYGVLPTPTPRIISLPTLRWERPVLPTLSFPDFNGRPFPTTDPVPSVEVSPSPSDYRFDRTTRPIRPR